jgi:hypothetical protein
MQQSLNAWCHHFSQKLKDKAASSSYLLHIKSLQHWISNCKQPAEYLQQARGKKVGRKACE